MLRFLLLIPIVISLIFLSIVSISDGIAILAFSLVIVALLSFLYLQYMKFEIQVRMDIPTKTAERGQAFGLRLRVENRNFIKTGKLEMLIKVKQGSVSCGKERKIGLAQALVGESTHITRLSIEDSGYYEFFLKKFRIYDPFGLFYITCKCSEKCNILIMPSIEAVPLQLGEGVKQFHGESTFYDDQRAGNDPTETFEIREYREGDKLQRVHWKISARSDELMVKESSLPKACPVVLFMPDKARTTSDCMDYLASLSFTLMDQGCSHYLAWYSKDRHDVHRSRVDDEESFYAVIVECLKDTVNETDMDLIERYREKYRGDAYLHSIQVPEKDRICVDAGELMTVETLREELLLA